MVRIAPVRLAFNPKILWFDALDLDLSIGDAVVVNTARGMEFGHISQHVFEMKYEKTKQLKSPLKSVVRLATLEDEMIAEEKAQLSMQALPIFRRLAADCAPDMNPIAVEYLFDSNQAVFYFDAKERIDFRDLVRKLAAEFSIRVDMKQIGVRDGARMVGGLGHCGQELCCARLGGQFSSVSIRMAKEQDLSLNPQKISGLCGRLMCCLRYEFDAYKDFHSRAPKKNACINTPDGVGKVIDYDVPREMVFIKVDENKPVKVPLADIENTKKGTCSQSVSDEAWINAQTQINSSVMSSSSLFSSSLFREDKLAEPGKVNRPSKTDALKDADSSSNTRSRRLRRRRKTDSKTQEGHSEVEQQLRDRQSTQKKQVQVRKKRGRSTKVSTDGHIKTEQQKKSVKVGRNSSGLRSNRSEKPATTAGSGRSRHRRRSHKTSSSSDSQRGK